MKLRSSLALSVFFLAPLLASACSSSGESSGGTARVSVDAPTIEASVAHRDARLGVPSFAWINKASAPKFASAHEAAKATMPSLAKTFELSKEAMMTVAAVEVDERNVGPIVARYKQSIGGIEVFRGRANVLFSRAYEPMAATGLLAPSLKGSERPFALGEEEGLARALAGFGVASPSFVKKDRRGSYEHFTVRGLASARTKRVFFPSKTDAGVELEPAYYVDLIVKGGAARAYVVSAIDGRQLFTTDLVKYDHSYRVWADPQSFSPSDGPQGNGVAPHPTGRPDRMKLSYQPMQLVTLRNVPFSKNDPWLGDGATKTAGNNVMAYADLGDLDGYDVGTDVLPEVTSPNVFDFTYDTTKSPAATPESIKAATTQLFYVTNYLHDWFYDAGFDEVGLNHQESNLGRGGDEGDALLAEAQDFSGRNNANAAVPPDGSSPRIQMFVFSGPRDASLVVSAPANVAGTKSVGIASGFGLDAFDVSGSVVLAVDEGGTDPNDACEAISNGVSGKIALVHRGTCSFAQKAAAAQTAGALGVIIANVATSAAPTVAPFMGGQQAGITIPVLSLSLADGQALEGAQGVTAEMKRSLLVDLDGALDTAIVAHEWGHVLSSRLVGDGIGLTTNQAGGLGEGWGDFLSLLVVARQDDAPWSGVFSQGAYATSGSGDDVYFGTRRVPYSIDFSKNALTLKHIANGVALPTTVATSFGEDGSFNSEVHNTGEVWATMLWECYVALLNDGRFSFTQAQERMKRYLVASLKLTPVDPTIIEARDAVLAAALASDEADFKLFFDAFARRGAGSGAVAPPKDSASNAGVRESFSSANDVQIVDATIKDDVITCDHDGILDDGEVGTVEITLRNTGSGTLSAARAELSPKADGVRLIDVSPATVPVLKPFETTTLKVKTTVNAVTKAVDPLAFDITIADPSLPDGKVVTVAVPTRYNADQAADAATIDRVETQNTPWKAAGKDELGVEWGRTLADGNRFWKLPDPLAAGDYRLTSPAFTIEGTTFGLSFKHRYSFRFSTRRNVDINGGVVEVSLDKGKTWKDISTYGSIAYNSTLDDSREDNVLGGRKAFGNKSQGFPAWLTTKVDVTLPDHPEAVQIRFRAGSGLGRTVGDGWDIDDIELTGIASLPFYAYVPHADACDPDGPSANAGLPQTVLSGASVTLQGSATHPKNANLSYTWAQRSGPPVALSADTTPTPVFVAPDVDAPTTLTFVLRANDGALLSPASEVPVTVNPASFSGGGGGCGCKTTGTSVPDASGVALAALGLFVVRRRKKA